MTINNKNFTRLFALILFVTIISLNIKTLNSYFIADEFDIITSFYNKGWDYYPKLFVSDYMSPRRGQEIAELMNLKQHIGMIRPFVIYSHKLELTLFGTKPLAYHLTNAFLHFLSALFVFWIINLVTDNRNRLWGFIGGMLFAVNPALFQVVGWIGTRGETMAVTVYLAGFYFFLKYRTTQTRKYYYYSLLIFLIGLFTKENLVVLPILLIGYDLLRELKWFEDPDVSLKRDTLAAVKRNALAWLPYLVLLICYFLLRKLTLGSFVGGYGESHLGLNIKRKLLNIAFYIRYVFLAAPFDLDNMFNVVKKKSMLVAMGSFFMVLLSVFAAGFRNMNWRLLMFGALWAAVSYIPIFFYPFAGAPIILYPLMAGISAMLVALIFSLPWRKISLIGAVSLIAFYAYHQFEYNANIGYAGSVTKRITKDIEKASEKFKEGDTIVLVDIPQFYDTYVFICDTFLQAALERPFTASDLTKRFNIKRATYWSRGLFKSYPSVDQAIATSPVDRDIHLFIWNEMAKRLEAFEVPVFIRDLTWASVEARYPNSVRVEFFNINRDLRMTLFQEPTSKVTYKLKVPDQAFLSFGVGLPPATWQRRGQGGVSFKILAKNGKAEEVLFSKYIEPQNKERDRKWHDEKIDLSRYGGAEISLTFITASSTKEPIWAGWGEPRLVVR